jgi:hypothetical protein
MEQDNIIAYVGVDWADECHSVHLQAAGGPIEHCTVAQTPDVLHAWVTQLRQRFPSGHIAVAIEQRKGAVIHALMQYDFLML